MVLNDCFWHIASVRCDANLVRYRGTADIDELAGELTPSRMTRTGHHCVVEPHCVATSCLPSVQQLRVKA